MFNERFDIQLTLFQLKGVLNRYKLKSGRTGHWKKGQPAWNKGKTWDEYMSPEGQENSRKTCFSADDRSINKSNHNELPIGTEREYRGYIIVKTNNSNRIPAYIGWEFKHHVIYEQAHGKIPKGHIVIFANGNNRNFDIDNLVLVSRAELAVINKNNLYFKNDADATKCGVSIAKLMIRRKQLAKK